MDVLKVGDTIECSDNDDMVKTFMLLAEQDIMTDFLYEKDGKKGLWLIVEEIKHE